MTQIWPLVPPTNEEFREFLRHDRELPIDSEFELFHRSPNPFTFKPHSAFPVAINNSGVVVGNVRAPSRDFSIPLHAPPQYREITRAFTYSNGVAQLIPVGEQIGMTARASVAFDVNNEGLVLGRVYEGPDRWGSSTSFLWDGESVTYLPEPDGTSSLKAMAINDHGHVVGRLWKEPVDGVSPPGTIFLFKDGQMFLDVVPLVSGVHPEGKDLLLAPVKLMNDGTILGLVGGHYQAMSFIWGIYGRVAIWRDGELELFDDTYDGAFDMNSNGLVLVKKEKIPEYYSWPYAIWEESQETILRDGNSYLRDAYSFNIHGDCVGESFGGAALYQNGNIYDLNYQLIDVDDNPDFIVELQRANAINDDGYIVGTGSIYHYSGGWNWHRFGYILEPQ